MCLWRPFVAAIGPCASDSILPLPHEASIATCQSIQLHGASKQVLQQMACTYLPISCCIQCSPSADSLSASGNRLCPKQFVGNRANLIMDLAIEQTLCIIKPDACKAQKQHEIMQVRPINSVYIVVCPVSCSNQRCNIV